MWNCHLIRLVFAAAVVVHEGCIGSKIKPNPQVFTKIYCIYLQQAAIHSLCVT